MRNFFSFPTHRHRDVSYFRIVIGFGNDRIGQFEQISNEITIVNRFGCDACRLEARERRLDGTEGPSVRRTNLGGR